MDHSNARSNAGLSTSPVASQRPQNRVEERHGYLRKTSPRAHEIGEERSPAMPRVEGSASRDLPAISQSIPQGARDVVQAIATSGTINIMRCSCTHDIAPHSYNFESALRLGYELGVYQTRHFGPRTCGSMIGHSEPPQRTKGSCLGRFFNRFRRRNRNGISQAIEPMRSQNRITQCSAPEPLPSREEDLSRVQQLPSPTTPAFYTRAPDIRVSSNGYAHRRSRTRSSPSSLPHPLAPDAHQDNGGVAGATEFAHMFREPSLCDVASPATEYVVECNSLCRSSAASPLSERLNLTPPGQSRRHEDSSDMLSQRSQAGQRVPVTEHDTQQTPALFSASLASASAAPSNLERPSRTPSQRSMVSRHSKRANPPRVRSKPPFLAGRETSMASSEPLDTDQPTPRLRNTVQDGEDKRLSLRTTSTEKIGRHLDQRYLESNKRAKGIMAQDASTSAQRRGALDMSTIKC